MHIVFRSPAMTVTQSTYVLYRGNWQSKKMKEHKYKVNTGDQRNGVAGHAN